MSVPRGSTALYDAIGRTINEVGARLAATPEPDRPGKVIVAILTDGQENASTEFSRETIATMISHQQKAYAWEFVFLAANHDENARRTLIVVVLTAVMMVGEIVAGVLTGGSTWWIAVATLVSFLRDSMSDTTLARINAVAGVLLMLFGAVMLGRLLWP